MELYVFVLTCVLTTFMLIMFVLDWYDNYKERKTMFIKDNEWLLMEDNTKDIYNTSFAKARYVRPGSYIQDVRYDEITFSENIKETIKKKGE